jgi:hypothetical protein
MQWKTKNAHFSITKTTACLKHQVCFVICFSARNGGMTVVVGTNDKLKKNGRDVLHLPSYHPDLNPI